VEKISNATDNPADLRVYFAGERTTLAWVRTGLAMMGFGFVVARFGLFLRELADARGLSPQRGQLSLWAGVALVVLGVVVNVYAAVRHANFTRRFDSGRPARPSSSMPIVVAAMLACIGLFVAGYLIATH
jgi:putative membrane protein